MLQVRVRISSYCQGCQAESQEVRGLLAKKNGVFYLRYDEPAAAGLGLTHTTLKWGEDWVLLLRTGALQHRQEFRAGLSHRSLYQTTQLELPLVTTTKAVAVSNRLGAWRLELDYLLSTGPGPASARRVLIEIEEEARLGD